MLALKTIVLVVALAVRLAIGDAQWVLRVTTTLAGDPSSYQMEDVDGIGTIRVSRGEQRTFVISEYQHRLNSLYLISVDLHIIVASVSQNVMLQVVGERILCQQVEKLNWLSLDHLDFIEQSVQPYSFVRCGGQPNQFCLVSAHSADDVIGCVTTSASR